MGMERGGGFQIYQGRIMITWWQTESYGSRGDAEASYIYAEEEKELEKNNKEWAWTRTTQYRRNQIRRGFQEGGQQK